MSFHCPSPEQVFKDNAFTRAFFNRLANESDRILLEALENAVDQLVAQEYTDSGFNVKLKPRE